MWWMKVPSEAWIPYKQTSGWPASPRNSDKSKHGIPRHENTSELSSAESEEQRKWLTSVDVTNLNEQSDLTVAAMLVPNKTRRTCFELSEISIRLMNYIKYTEQTLAQTLSYKEFTKVISKCCICRVKNHSTCWLVFSYRILSRHIYPWIYHERQVVLYDQGGTPGESLWGPQKSSDRHFIALQWPQKNQTSTL